jgi:hypothetical protein
MPAERILANLTDETALGTQAGSSHGNIGGGTTGFWAKGRYFCHSPPNFGRKHVNQQFA